MDRYSGYSDCGHGPVFRLLCGRVPVLGCFDCGRGPVLGCFDWGRRPVLGCFDCGRGPVLGCFVVVYRY